MLHFLRKLFGMKRQEGQTGNAAERLEREEEKATAVFPGENRNGLRAL